MASSVLPRFLRSQCQPAKKIIPLLNKQILHEPPPLQTSSALAHLFESENRPAENSSLDPSGTKNSSLSRTLFFPSFSASLFLNPISSTGLIEDDILNDVSDESSTIWADSVKKKRKRKMNKHKLRKLRRRLRRKT